MSQSRTYPSLQSCSMWMQWQSRDRLCENTDETDLRTITYTESLYIESPHDRERFANISDDRPSISTHSWDLTEFAQFHVFLQLLRNSTHVIHLKISQKYDFLDDWRLPSISSPIRLQCQRRSKVRGSKSQNSKMNWPIYLWIDAIKFIYQLLEWRSAFMLSELRLRQMFSCLQHFNIESYRAWTMHRFMQTLVLAPWRLNLFLKWVACVCISQRWDTFGSPMNKCMCVCIGAVRGNVNSLSKVLRISDASRQFGRVV